jgi:hypothetical protein
MLIILFLLFISAVPANAVPYTITKIDQIEASPTSLSIAFAGTINNAGTVVIHQYPDLLTGSGGPLTTLPIPANPRGPVVTAAGTLEFFGASRPWINDQGEVVFRGGLRAVRAAQ